MIKKRMFWTGVLALGFLAVLFLLVMGKRLRPNLLFAGRYALDGVDVSHYQGEIDWARLREQGIDFAYIKATEGSSLTDDCFAANWQGAEEAGIHAGAYHFFSFDSEPETQAELYIETVGDLTGRLIPVVDVEYYGNTRKHPPQKEELVRDLERFLKLLEEEYQVKPVIYTTQLFYEKYVKGSFTEYPLWIRSVYIPPLGLGRSWQFWQYTDRAVLEGYTGAEKYIDRNVFYGTEEELEQYIITEM